MRKTKIVATIGPSSWDKAILTRMISEGMNVARINASFADFAELERVSNLIRSLSNDVAIMLDTKGHKIRVTGFENEIELQTGEEISIKSEGATTNYTGKVIDITYPTLAHDITRNTKILLDDGNISLLVKDIKQADVICEVTFGGILKKRKTVNIPGMHLNFPGLSDKDREDIKYAVQNSFDYISASFIRNVEDVSLIREILKDSDTKLIAKIEDYEGVTNFDQILQKVDGIMVARGDMGVELPIEQVPVLQKGFIKKCREAGKPVIVATQMLESMRENIKPTRAEVSDVANAVFDGADAVMLSAETSTGRYPVEAVSIMSKIITETEKHLNKEVINTRTDLKPETDALCKAILELTEEVPLDGVIVLTKTGRTVRSLARHKLNVPIWSITVNPIIARQQALNRGVKSFYIKDFPTNRDEIIKLAANLVYVEGYLKIDSIIAIISGSSIHNKSSNSILEIGNIKDLIA